MQEETLNEGQGMGKSVLVFGFFQGGKPFLQCFERGKDNSDTFSNNPE